MGKKILSNAFNIPGTIYQMIVIYGTHVYICKMIISPASFFIFSKLFSSFLAGWGGAEGREGIKVQKTVQNDKNQKNLPVTGSISQEPYIT